MITTSEKRRAFRQLHQAGCFVLPNPWDVGTTRYLQHLGFKAVATTSAGFAYTAGLADNAVPRDLMLAHLRKIASATELPVNADFESGYAADATGVAESVRLCVETGVSGLSIEDSTGNKDAPLYELDEAVIRLRASRAAIDQCGQSGSEVLLTARCECFFVGRPDLDEAIRRLRAYSEAGADCLYAPGIKTAEQIVAVVKAVAPKPVNFLMSSASGFSVSDLAALGVRRISVGSALSRVVWAAFLGAAREIAEAGTFTCFANPAAPAELNGFFRADQAARQNQ